MHLKTAADVAKYMGSIQDQLLEALLGCMRSVILELPPRERMAQLLGKAISDLVASQRITLSVNPASAVLVNDALADLGSLLPSGGIEVKVRPDLPVESCILETPMGIVDASLESQLQALKTFLSTSVTASPQAST